MLNLVKALHMMRKLNSDAWPNPTYAQVRSVMSPDELLFVVIERLGNKQTPVRTEVRLVDNQRSFQKAMMDASTSGAANLELYAQSLLTHRFYLLLQQAQWEDSIGSGGPRSIQAIYEIRRQLHYVNRLLARKDPYPLWSPTRWLRALGIR